MSSAVVEVKCIEALQHTGDPDDLNYIFSWVEENTAGRFNYTTVRSGNGHTPKSGVSIDPVCGRMVLATRKGLRHIDKGDYILRNSKGQFSKLPAKDFEAMFEEVFDED